MTDERINEDRKAFDVWWNKTVGNGQWTMLERMAAHDAWMNSAELARKEVAERVECAWREHGEDITLRILRAAILAETKDYAE